jgi:4-coumarate--CoA ligase
VNAFTISSQQAAKVIAGILFDELSGEFKRYIDFLTAASWTGDTPIGANGIGLDAAERAHCAAAVERFFGLEGAIDPTLGAVVADWADRIETAAMRDLRRLRFKPGGRSGAAAVVEHAAAAVYKDAAAAANLLHGRRRIVSLVAPHGLIAFVTTVLAANLLRIESIDARGRALDELRDMLQFGDALVATPTIWRYLISDGLRAPDNVIGVAFGETLAPELGAEMRKSGFGAIRELYGSTETGLVAWRDTLSEPFTLFEHWRRDGDGIVRVNPVGETAFSSMDQLDWSDTRSFRLGPRRDGAVQVGAVNVFPDQIAATIRAHPSVAACEVAVMRQADGVNRLVARLRLKRGEQLNERAARDIDAWCRTQLRPPERPRIYSFEEPVAGE